MWSVFYKKNRRKEVSWVAMGRLLIQTIEFPSLIILIIQNPLQPFSDAEEKKNHLHLHSSQQLHLSRLSLQLFCTFAQNQLPGMLFLGVLPHSDVRPKHPLFFRGKWASSSPNTHPFGHHCCSQLCHHLRLPSKMNK